jgi:hypothetical protein
MYLLNMYLNKEEGRQNPGTPCTLIGTHQGAAKRNKCGRRRQVLPNTLQLHLSMSFQKQHDKYPNCNNFFPGATPVTEPLGQFLPEAQQHQQVNV